MNLNIDNEQLKSALMEALLSSIPQAARDEMIRQAIANLVTPRSNGYGSTKKSELQEVYERAISMCVAEIARDQVRNDPTINAEILKAIEPYRHSDYKRHAVIVEASLEAVLEYHTPGQKS